MSCQLFPSSGGGFESFDALMLYCPFAATLSVRNIWDSLSMGKSEGA